MNDEEYERERLRIRGQFSDAIQCRGLHDSVWGILEMFSSAIDRCTKLYRTIEENRVVCALDIEYLDVWELGAHVDLGSWGPIKINCGTALALADASVTLANNPNLWAYDRHVVNNYAHLASGSHFEPNCLQMLESKHELSGSLFKAASRYIVSHEVSHLNFGHTFMPPDFAIKHRPILEYQADTFAAVLATRADSLVGLTYGRTDDERWRIAVAGALMAFALCAIHSGPSSAGYPRMQTRWLMVLWMLFSKKYYPNLKLDDSMWIKTILDALAIKWLFGCDWLEPLAILQLYTRKYPTDEGMRELHELTQGSDALLDGPQACFLAQVDDEFLRRQECHND